MKKAIQWLVVITAFLVVSSVNAQRHVVTNINGVAVTGTNRMYGQPIADYGPPLGTVGFSNVGIYNPGGQDPMSIDENSPGDAVLATIVDPDFLAAVGLPITLIDQNLVNIPLREVGINVSPAGDVREPVPDATAVDPLVPNQAIPAGPISLDEWLSAKGTARIACGDLGGAISLVLKGLLSNRIYTIWGIFESAAGAFVAVPLGGAPNVIATDGSGKGSFRRVLNYCPFETTEQGSRLLAIDVVYHSDQQVYGFVPDLTLKGFITGTTTHTQLEFTISGESLLKADSGMHWRGIPIKRSMGGDDDE